MNDTQAGAPFPAPKDRLSSKIHVYTGDGKGKTTAALGQAFRAAGHGLRVHILHFMKNDPNYGEMLSAAKMGENWQVEQYGRKSFVRKNNPALEDINLAHQGLERARTLASNGTVDLLVLDELVNALDFNLLELDAVLDLLRTRAPNTEIILTGRNAPAQLIQAADLVTQMQPIKHYYDTGTPARVGIES
ncbi:MAG: cob(I)yrinic acid a,c-diamide adenosyltransferase [Desulfuromonadaceae bacterium]|nr:cob(I)yrinic acid a,c-diamide adenosyltransferase [Desulfuromonadaceae bacterium]